MDEQTFQEAVKRVRASTTRDELASAIQTSLKSLLRKPEDRDLLQSLLSQADSLTKRLPDNDGGQIRQAAVRCVVLLETAAKDRPLKKSRRIPILIGTAAAVGLLYILLLL
jgi:hypothetical protein